MLLNTSESKVSLNKVFRLSSSAAWLWEQLVDKDFTETEVVTLICSEYEVAEDVAKRDVNHLLDVWKNNGIIS
ncbi:MAG: PqqD family protein [Bacteroidales bacterium]|nr:PqqD family protein [Bacteroidales bacterium]